MRRSGVLRAGAVGGPLLLLVLAGCRGEGPDALDGPPPDDPSIAVLVGRLGPGAPPDGGVPDRIELVFSGRSGGSVTTTARDGRYQVTLPPGTWDVRSTDGKACANGIELRGGARYQKDLVYPGECFDAAPPPDPPGPAAPPS